LLLALINLGNHYLYPIAIWRKNLNEPIHIQFGVKADSLQMEQITKLLGIKPTSGWNPGEIYLSKNKKGEQIVQVKRNRPPFGVWHFSTKEKQFPEMAGHALYLLEVLETARESIEELLRLPDHEVVISFWYVGPVGFDVSASVLSRLASLCHRTTFRFFES